MPVADGHHGWEDLTAIQQARLLGYDQISSYDNDERDMALAGGKAKPGKGN
jgi:hypothetical protein